MNELGMGLAPWKRRGEWAELRFMASATEHGLCVSKPWGETSHYDFVVEGRTGLLLRVQVKSSGNMWHGGYTVNNKGSQGMYPANAYDFMAVFVIPHSVWFILPEEVLRGKKAVQVQHKKGRSKYEKYREAWGLLGGRERAGGGEDGMERNPTLRIWGDEDGGPDGV